MKAGRRRTFYNESFHGERKARCLDPLARWSFSSFVLLFGGKKIPELTKGLGEGIRHFKESVKGQNPKDGHKGV